MPQRTEVCDQKQFDLSFEYGSHAAVVFSTRVKKRRTSHTNELFRPTTVVWLGFTLRQSNTDSGHLHVNVRIASLRTFVSSKWTSRRMAALNNLEPHENTCDTKDSNNDGDQYARDSATRQFATVLALFITTEYDVVPELFLIFDVEKVFTPVA
jgi:hypothetical protein